MGNGIRLKRLMYKSSAYVLIMRKTFSSSHPTLDPGSERHLILPPSQHRPEHFCSCSPGWPKPEGLFVSPQKMSSPSSSFSSFHSSNHKQYSQRSYPVSCSCSTSFFWCRQHSPSSSGHGYYSVLGCLCFCVDENFWRNDVMFMRSSLETYKKLFQGEINVILWARP